MHKDSTFFKEYSHEIPLILNFFFVDYNEDKEKDKEREHKKKDKKDDKKEEVSKSQEEKRKHIKSLIDKIPTDKNALFAFNIDWGAVDNVSPMQNVLQKFTDEYKCKSLVELMRLFFFFYKKKF